MSGLRLLLKIVLPIELLPICIHGERAVRQRMSAE